jgi:hypothetical protein
VANLKFENLQVSGNILKSGTRKIHAKKTGYRTDSTLKEIKNKTQELRLLTISAFDD